MSQEKSVLRSVVDDIPRDFSKRALWAIFSSVFIVGIASMFGYKSISIVFPGNSDLVGVYAKLDGKALPGETIELHPSALQGTVKTNGEVQWAGLGVPFDVISKRTVELRRISNSGGKKTSEVLFALNVDDKPVLAFIIGGK
ncbi:hypothetical protein [Teredinibacter turnerae]|uniref:hypothetical protein n=1 Tax=Teredinibacter turnerae TaxID=2426 RepID=UPI0005653451|nr:hypothetical protein [Teredinibacter turnerae]